VKLVLLLALPIIAIAVPANAQDQKERLRNGLKNIAQMDANKDGVVTRAEVAAERAKIFVRYDRDKDTQLTSNDIPTAMALMGANAMFENLKKTYDANKDGKVTRAEFMSGPTPAFDLADANKDNKVTKAEQQAALAKLS
jgi:Ca2+-binding EF-hand superfamily protein